MPLTYTFSPQEETVLLTADGVIDFRSIAEVMQSVSADPAFDPRYTIIVDVRQMKFTPSSQELFRIRDTLISFSHTVKGGITLVVGESKLHVGRVFRALAKAYDIEIKIVTSLGMKETSHREH
jgi:hypothetical protein